MHRGGSRTVVLAAALVVLSGCGSSAPPQAAEQACGKAVLADWADGRIDGTYPDPCYLAALDAMPEDLRAYSTAKDDISRALHTHRDAP